MTPATINSLLVRATEGLGWRRKRALAALVRRYGRKARLLIVDYEAALEALRRRAA